MALPECQYCGTPIEGQAAVCTVCATPHHVECFKESGTCTTYACGNASYFLGDMKTAVRVCYRPTLPEREHLEIVDLPRETELQTARLAIPYKATRAVGILIDGFVAGIVASFVGTAFVGILGPLGLPFVYFASGLFWAFRDVTFDSASPGKRLLGMKVVNREGKPITPAQSLQRNLPLAAAQVVSAFSLLALGAASPLLVLFHLVVMGIWGLEAAFVLHDWQGRRWGDGLAGTRVVRVREKKK